jgi:hypothetical protein
MKRYNILVHSFRNHKENFEDDVIGICAGLWNLVLSYWGTTLIPSPIWIFDRFYQKCDF